MKCPLILLAMAFSLGCARLPAQGACVQSESDPVAKCMDCEAARARVRGDMLPIEL